LHAHLTGKGALDRQGIAHRLRQRLVLGREHAVQAHAIAALVGGGQVGRLVFEPGWRWSSDVKPLA
jgi:hypothetical protein